VPVPRAPLSQLGLGSATRGRGRSRRRCWLLVGSLQPAADVATRTTLPLAKKTPLSPLTTRWPARGGLPHPSRHVTTGGRVRARPQDKKTCQPPSKERSKDKTKPTAALITPGYKPQECCWGCGQREHTRRFCRRPAKLFCSQCGKEGVLIKNCHGTLSGNRNKAGDGGETFRSTTDPRPFGKIRVLGHRYTTLLDCGAVLSYVSEATADRIRPFARSRRITTAVYLADGQVSPITEELNISVQLGRYHGRQTFHVLPGMTVDVIAGIILLRKAGFQWLATQCRDSTTNRNRIRRHRERADCLLHHRTPKAADLPRRNPVEVRTDHWHHTSNRALHPPEARTGADQTTIPLFQSSNAGNNRHRN